MTERPDDTERGGGMAGEMISSGDLAEPVGVWVYCVADGREGRTRLAGVRGGAVEVVREADLSAYVSAVDLAEFGEQALRHNLEDLDWLATVARAHHDVVGALAAAGPVVPMRLATVYRGRQGVAAMLERSADALRATLERVRSRREWGVKVYAAEEAARTKGGENPAGAAVTGAPRSGPGTAYLRRRRAELSASERSRAAAAASAEAVHADLSRVACAARLHPPQAPQLTGARTQMLVNGAYLVDEDRNEEFARAVRTLAARHPSVSVEMTGPWPPYSFASVVEDGP